ncbi:MAG TPA: glycosyltransferase family 4 protein [Acidocella sp.]|nr:glycosyltransferase family 4 protein [Acidocella sp.]
MNPVVKKAGHAVWRLLPHEFRRNAMTSVAAQLAGKPNQPWPHASNGVVVAGDIAGDNGLAETARLFHDVIHAAGLSRGQVPLGLPGVVEMGTATVPPDAALLAVVNAPILPVGLLRMPRHVLKQRRVIGVWAWELPVVPRQWEFGAQFVHEIWAPSSFTAEALETIAPGRVRLVPYPLAAFTLPATGNRDSFGLHNDAVIVLTAFNLNSGTARKNPLGAIAAFKAAFGSDERFQFIMKISGAEAYAADLRSLAAAIGSAPNIKIINENLTEPRLRGLIAACDIVLSLHRSEGFGLIPATAMLLGKPVVATGWSGNLTFMTPETSALVSYRLVPPVDERGVYEVAGARWAEPDIEDAAAQLRRLGHDAALRQILGLAGQTHARAVLGAAPVLAALHANGIH